MKAIEDKRKPRQKNEIPYRLKSAVENRSTEQHRENAASNEAATEQTQRAVGEVVYRSAQVPPQIRYAIKKYRLKKEQKRVDAQEEAVRPDIIALPSADTAPDQPGSSQKIRTSPEPDIGRKSEQTHHPISPRSEIAPRKALSGGRGGIADSVQSVDRSAPKQKSLTTPKTKQHVEKQAAYKHIRPEKGSPASATQSIAQKAAEQGRLRFKKNVQKQSLQQAQKAAKTTGEALKTAGVALGHAAKAVIGWLIGLVGGIGLVAILCLVLLVAAVAASPFGIFFTNEPSTNTIPLSSAVAQINMELNTRLIELQDGEYETIEIHGAPPAWAEVIAVFAAYIAGAEDGMDVALLDTERVELLRDTFWDMCSITGEVETEEPPTTDGTEPTEAPLETLHITITAKTAEEMRTVYGFNDFQNEALDMLLAEGESINAMVGNLSISQADALALLSDLPNDLSLERRAIVQQALMLVGKVNYFWGGKSLVLGWDSRWGQLTKVSAAGSPTTGTYRPYGLDCSGFADWVFYNASGGEYIIGHGGGAADQHRYCTNISWSGAQPGDLVFYPDDSHVGIVGGWDESGNILIIHCASGHNNVVITGKTGFTSVGRPYYYGE